MNSGKLIPAPLRFIESPVILCVWSDSALHHTYDAGTQVHDARARKQNSNYWSLVLPRTGKITQPWLLFNMSPILNQWEVINKMRSYVTYSYEMVLLHPPRELVINYDQRSDWLHDSFSKRGFELITQYTGSADNAAQLLQRIGTYDTLFE